MQAAQLPANRAAQTSLQFIVNPGTVSQKYLNRDAIFWQAPLATDQTYGDVAEIGYFVQWDETNAANPRARLCRLFINPTSANATDSNYKIYSDPTHWITDSVINAVAPADKTGMYQGLFVENVIGLWVTCLDSNGVELSAVFDSRNVTACVLPAAVDLSFVMLDTNSANRITGPLETAIKYLAAKPDLKDANDFVNRTFADPAFNAIRSGLRPCKTRIYLQNSK